MLNTEIKDCKMNSIWNKHGEYIQNIYMIVLSYTVRSKDKIVENTQGKCTAMPWYISLIELM